MVQRPKSIFCLVCFVLLTWPQKNKQYFVWPFFWTQAEKPNHVWSFFPPDPSPKPVFCLVFSFSFLTLAQKPKSILYLVFLFSRPKPQNEYQTLITVIRESDPKLPTSKVKPMDYRSWWNEWSSHLARWTGNHSCAVARTQTPAAWLGPPDQSQKILLDSCIFIITIDTFKIKNTKTTDSMLFF